MKMRGFMALLLLSMVIVYFLYIVKSGEQEMIKESVDTLGRAKQLGTELNMKTMQRTIISFIAAQGYVPQSLDQVRRMNPMFLAGVDEWGTVIGYERLSDEGFRLMAAGPDRSFGTEDDLVLDY